MRCRITHLYNIRYCNGSLITRFGNYMEEVSGITAFINDFKVFSYESLGIICRSDRHAQTHPDACMWQGRFEKASEGD